MGAWGGSRSTVLQNSLSSRSLTLIIRSYIPHLLKLVASPEIVSGQQGTPPEGKTAMLEYLSCSSDGPTHEADHFIKNKI